MREADGIAERVDLPLALADAGLHVGVVGLAPGEGFAAGEVGHEGIGVGVGKDAASLPSDYAFNESREFCVGGDEGQIGPDLRGGVPQPHGRDVAGDDDGVGTGWAILN